MSDLSDLALAEPGVIDEGIYPLGIGGGGGIVNGDVRVGVHGSMVARGDVTVKRYKTMGSRSGAGDGGGHP